MQPQPARQNEFNGGISFNLQLHLSLKGIGPYTAGAIASIAFNLPQPAVDGKASVF